MASYNHSTSSPIFVGLKGMENNHPIVTIHIIHHWSNENGVFITSYDADGDTTDANHVTRPISDYVVLRALDKSSLNKTDNYFAI